MRHFKETGFRVSNLKRVVQGYQLSPRDLDGGLLKISRRPRIAKTIPSLHILQGEARGLVPPGNYVWLAELL